MNRPGMVEITLDYLRPLSNSQAECRGFDSLRPLNNLRLHFHPARLMHLSRPTVRNRTTKRLTLCGNKVWQLSGVLLPCDGNVFTEWQRRREYARTLSALERQMRILMQLARRSAYQRAST